MKKLFCFLLTLVLVLSLLGCNAAPAPAPVATTEATVPPTTEPLFQWYEEKTIAITAEQVDRIVNMEFQKPKNII